MNVYEEAKKIISGRYCVIDTETTGVDWSDEILSIAIISSHRKTLLSSLVKPKRAINEAGRAYEINGISNEMVADAPTWRDLYPQYRAAIYGCAVVAYNARFDAGMIDAANDRYTLERPANVWRCVMLLYSVHHGEFNTRKGSYTWKRLADAVDRLGVNREGAAHGSLSDALAAYDVLQALAAKA
jgi:DNA polymerase III epsilon subunit-like protein